MSGESKTPADMRDALLDVAAAANDALYTYYATPEAAAKGKKDRQFTCVKLPLLAVSKELGSPRQDGTRAVYGVSCASDGEGHAEVKLFVDGVRVGTASLDVGHTTAWAIAKQMKYYLISRKEKAMRHRANVRARREGGAV